MVKYIRFTFIIALALMLAACSNKASSSNENKEKPNQGSATADEAQKAQTTEKPIKLYDYAKEIGASITKPTSEEFSVKSSFVLSGKIEDAELDDRYAWINVSDPDSNVLHYYIPIKDGEFQQKIKLFAGKGEYNVRVSLPDKDQEEHSRDVAELNVTNESDKITRDVEMTLTGLKSGLQLKQPKTGYAEAKQFLHLSGKVDSKYNGQYLLIKGVKEEDDESEPWQIMAPVKDGTFNADFPLHYGKGESTIKVMVPDPDRDNYYLEAAILAAKNTSSERTKPIEYYDAYYDKKFQLNEPKSSDLKAGQAFHISGTYDMHTDHNSKINQLIVTTKKKDSDDDDMEASYLVPAQNGQFDGDFWLRFGPGKYKVTVNIPVNLDDPDSHYKYQGIATFHVQSDAKDQRNLLPSQGIQSDAPKIKDLSQKLTKGKGSKRKKSKAIYKYVSKNVAYDVKKWHKDLFEVDDSALKTLKTKDGVCQDYSYLTVALLRAAGIESRAVTGSANLERHEWVEAKINGDWVLMDPTWGAGYVDDDKFTFKYNDKYFDPNLKQFKKDHSRGEIVY